MIPAFGEIGEALRRSTVQVREGRRSGGSGVIWNSDGLIVTNAHVATSRNLTVDLWDGRTYPAELRSRDARRDLAALAVTARQLTAATGGDSGRLRPGELVIAVGNPLGFTGALSTGVVHSTGAFPGLGKRNWVQAAIRLAPGNSGGPLADSLGRVIGINTMVVSGGLALAVPVSTVRQFLAAGPAVELGVTVRAVRLPARPGIGLLVLEVGAGSPAEHASLLPGDILTGANGRAFSSAGDLLDAIEQGLGAPLSIEFLRGDAGRTRGPGAAGQAGRRLTRVSVVAGSPVVRAGLRALLEEAPGFEVVDTLTPAESDQARGDVMVIDGGLNGLTMSDTDGPGVVLLTGDADSARQSELWPSRLRAILPPGALAIEIVAAVHAVAAGFVLLRPEEAARAQLPPRALAAGGEPLTPREMEVLQMIAAGESNKRIAWKLGISEHTVKFHVASILSKLAAGSRAEAVTVGMRRGLIYL